MNPFTIINSLYYPKNVCPLPTVIMIEPTDSCTLKCVMCDVQQQKNDNYHFISLPQFEFILNRFPRIRELIFCGIGEPLLNKDIFSMIRRAKEKKIPFINLITNGELLNPEISEKLLNSGLNQLHISIPAVTESAFNKIRNNPKVSLDELSINIKYLNQKKRSQCVKMKVMINIVMMNYNQPELKDAVYFCKNLGVDGICFVQLTTMFGEKENINVNRKEVSSLFAQLRKLGKKEKLDIVFLTGNDYGRCYQPWDFIMIHADGNISPCNGVMPTENMRLGNIFENTIGDIWNSERYRGLRRKVRMSAFKNCNFCESGYLIEGRNLHWFHNFYIRPIRNYIAHRSRYGL